jgi:hypothetical protein
MQLHFLHDTRTTRLLGSSFVAKSRRSHALIVFLRNLINHWKGDQT